MVQTILQNKGVLGIKNCSALFVSLLPQGQEMPPSILCAQEHKEDRHTWALCSTPNLLVAPEGPHFPGGSAGPSPRPVFMGMKVGTASITS